MNVRPATTDDLPAVLDIYNAAIPTACTADYEPRSLTDRQSWYQDRIALGCPVFVAVDANGDVVGWSSYGPYHSRIGYRFTMENSVYVAADQRGQGVGKQLLAALIDTARERGVHSILASIDSENEASIRLHATFGFERVAYLKEVIYKFDRWLDVIYMQWRIEP